MAGCSTLAIALASCGLVEDTGGPEPGARNALTSVIDSDDFGVLISDCDPGWERLPLLSEDPNEVQYLDHVIFCTTPGRDQIRVENRTEAVWRLYFDGQPVPIESATIDLRRRSFLAAVGALEPDNAIVPGEVVSAELSPDGTQIVIDLVHSVAWQGHEVVLDQMRSIGESVALTALRDRGSQFGVALAVCTQAVLESANRGRNLIDNPEAAEIVLDALNVTVAGSKCRDEALKARARDVIGQEVHLNGRLQSLSEQTDVLARLNTNLGWVQRVGRVVRFIPRGG